MTRRHLWRLGLSALGVLVFGVVVLGFSSSYRQTWLTTGRRWLRMPDRAAAEALARGRESLQQGRFRRAIKEVSVIYEGTPEEAEALTILGLALAALEEVGPARQVLERAWRLRPNAMAAKVLAAIYLAANESQRGLQVLQAAAQLVPDDFRPWYAMGECVYLPRRKYDDAASAFRESLKRLPSHLESRIGLVHALVEGHHPEEADPLMKLLLRERPDDPRVLILAVGFALEWGHEQDAERYLERTLIQEPDHREALLLRAQTQFRKGRTQEALSDAERALALAPNDLGALNLLGTIESALGLKERAAKTVARRREVEQRLSRIEELTQEIRQRPNDPEPRWRLGQAAAAAGMKPLAVQCYQVALALAPTCEPARLGLRELGVPITEMTPPAATELTGSSARSSARTSH
jgi:cytochrome c-type biogenesis protein CcmH/NrfG